LKIFKPDAPTDVTARVVNFTEFRLVDRELTLNVTSTAVLKMFRTTQQFDLKFSSGKN
jgi:hypothetical protein